jgi:hypothetical protein
MRSAMCDSFLGKGKVEVLLIPAPLLIHPHPFPETDCMFAFNKKIPPFERDSEYL